MQRPAFLADFEFTPRKIIVGVAVLLGLVGLSLLYRQIDVAALHQRASDLNGFVVFVLITVLPLVGVPVTITHAVAGVRFGIGWGLVIVAASILLQLLASFALVKLAPKLFEQRLDALRKRLPSGAHRPVTLFTILLPGVPYFAKNYVLPLIGVPLPTFLLWGGLIHVAKSTVGILFGDMSDDLTPLRIAGFALYALLNMAACVWAFRRLQAQLKVQRSKAGARKRRA